MKCPIDDTPLSVSSCDGVEIDFCPQCRGVWLDRGELDKIIDRAATSIAAASAPPEPRYDNRQQYDSRPRYDEPRYDDRSSKQRRRKNFLEDLFDFD